MQATRYSVWVCVKEVESINLTSAYTIQHLRAHIGAKREATKAVW